MPRRNDLKRILVVGSGPIVIGQACEFDYSGTQAIKALRSEGYEVVLVNSNPATIMTDPELADVTYIEPLTVDVLEAIIAKEKPDAILPTVGGQTALNLALALADRGVLEKYGVTMIGAQAKAIRIAEDRKLFRDAMGEIGLDVPKSVIAESLDDAADFADKTGYPMIIRPSFTLGGSGGGIAYNAQELETIVKRGLALSPVHQVLVEESLLGWKEYELEVMRDNRDNVVVVCSIENVDPMGVHTGDSITVAPAQTLTDHEYQRMRDAAAAILRKVGVETGGSNVQFAVDPNSGRQIVIEMNPRVSRSSALASKATGFPIAKIAAKLSVGYTLDEIANDITKKTPAAFEPTLDYVVTKIPKFAFEKFRGADETLGTQMKSVGEAMAMGRTLKESFFKALRSMEASKPYRPWDLPRDEMVKRLQSPNENRIRIVLAALEQGFSVDEVSRITHIDPWFLDQFEQFTSLQRSLRGKRFADVDDATLRRAKEYGFSDRRISDLTKASEKEIRERRHTAGIVPVYKRVDTCAAEFESYTPYFYSTYEQETEATPDDTRKVVILGSGPNRIGQGIEFDYCCCHASFALREAGVQSIMVNCNPETVSTDYDTSDRLYFEPLTLEDVLEVIRVEKPEGVIVQFGGQTPLNLTTPLAEAGVRILGTPADSVDLAEDRERFNTLLDALHVNYPPHAFAHHPDEAVELARNVGFPVLVRPSFVLGGRAMAIVYNEGDLLAYVREAFDAAPNGNVLIDRFLEDALEFDVDALADGNDCIIAGLLQHIEYAGVHSGDSTAVLPAYQISDALADEMKATTRKLAKALKVVGLMNVQFAIAGGKVYVLEVNPRASRTVPFIAKASGVPLAKIATRLMLGETLRDVKITRDLEFTRYFVKAPVFPFVKFPGVDPKLSPEMKSTGEVMGIAKNVGEAFYKAMLGAGTRLPREGTVLVTVADRDKKAVLPVAKRFARLGFKLAATRGTATFLRDNGLDVRDMLRLSEGRPNIDDAVRSGEIALIINTPLGGTSFKDGARMRSTAVQHNVPIITTIPGADAAASAIASLRAGDTFVGAQHAAPSSLQEIYATP